MNTTRKTYRGGCGETAGIGINCEDLEFVSGKRNITIHNENLKKVNEKNVDVELGD